MKSIKRLTKKDLFKFSTANGHGEHFR